MSFCCKNCFNDFYLQEYIDKNGEINQCDFCTKKNEKCIDVMSLKEKFIPFLDFYTPLIEFMSIEELKEFDGEFIWEKLTYNWEIFDDVELARKIIIEIFSEKDPDIEEPLHLTHPVENEMDFAGEFDESERVKKLWDNLSEAIKFHDRFLHKGEILDKDLLSELFQHLVYDISEGDTYFRARNCFRGQPFESAKMGKPPPEKTPSGRANPIGIPYLYLASDYKTAISEIRPNITDLITVAEFNVIEKISVIDLRDVSPFQFSLSENFEEGIKMIGFLDRLGSDLTEPINPSISDIDYLPTQYLCELIKNNGWDGVLYKSYFKNGYNVALFSEDKVESRNTKNYRVINADYSVSLLSPPASPPPP